MTKLGLYLADGPEAERGFRLIPTGPAHPYGRFLWPIPALGIGFTETKIIEVADFFESIVNDRLVSPNFYDGYRISQIVEAVQESDRSKAGRPSPGATPQIDSQHAEPPRSATSLLSPEGRAQSLWRGGGSGRRRPRRQRRRSSGARRRQRRGQVDAHQGHLRGRRCRAGSIAVDGRSVRFSGPEGPKALGIETVYQGSGADQRLRHGAELYLGRELRQFGGLALDHGGMAREAKRHLTAFSIRLPSLREKVRIFPAASARLSP